MPPVRDEEHEIQRKAHAKRVRETRRSTQGDDDDDDDEILDKEHKVEMITLKKILLRDNVDNEESMRNRCFIHGIHEITLFRSTIVI